MELGLQLNCLIDVLMGFICFQVPGLVPLDWSRNSVISYPSQLQLLLDRLVSLPLPVPEIVSVLIGISGTGVLPARNTQT